MSLALICKPIEVQGGQDPQTINIQTTGRSDSPNTTGVTIYYTVNNGAPQSPQVYPATGAVFGLSYIQAVTGLTSGDVVRVCLEAEISTMVDDSDIIRLQGFFVQVDANECDRSYAYNSPCEWTAIDPNATVPVCPSNQTIDCSDLPLIISGFANATNISSTGNTDYTVTPNAANTEVVIDGMGGDETIMITASDGTNSCVTVITVNECGICPELGDQTMIIDFDSPGTTGATTFGPYGTMTGTGALSFSGIFMSGVTINDVGGGQWEVVIDNSALTGGPENLIVSQDGVDCDVGTITVTGSAPPVI